MRNYKSIDDPQTRVYQFFQDHPFRFFDARAVAGKVKLSRRKVQQIIDFLENLDKLEPVHSHTSRRWGRPKILWRYMRGHDNHAALNQLEMFARYCRENGIIDEAPPEPPAEQIPLRVVS